jgi:IclR family transcriptional regulator, pca regulon regulatory protein
VVAALNVNCHAAETTVAQLVDHHLRLLLQAAGEISADFSRVRTVSHSTAPADHEPGTPPFPVTEDQ